MKGSYLRRGVLLSVLGTVFTSALFIFSNLISEFDFLSPFLIFSISIVAMGLFLMSQHFYWSRPENLEEYQKMIDNRYFDWSKDDLQKGAIIIFLGTISLGGASGFTSEYGLGLDWFLLIYGSFVVGYGAFLVIRHFYLSRPGKIEAYKKRLNENQIKMNDEHNKRLMEKAGQKMFVIMMFINAYILGGTLVLKVENYWRLLFLGLVIFQVLGYHLNYKYYKKKQ